MFVENNSHSYVAKRMFISEKGPHFEVRTNKLALCVGAVAFLALGAGVFFLLSGNSTLLQSVTNLRAIDGLTIVLVAGGVIGVGASLTVLIVRGVRNHQLHDTIIKANDSDQTVQERLSHILRRLVLDPTFPIEFCTTSKGGDEHSVDFASLRKRLSSSEEHELGAFFHQTLDQAEVCEYTDIEANGVVVAFLYEDKICSLLVPKEGEIKYFDVTLLAENSIGTNLTMQRSNEGANVSITCSARRQLMNEGSIRQ